MAKIEIINAQWISIDRLVNNEGQIPDVPKNPRTIDPEEYERLKQSLTEDPEFLGIRELVAYPLEDGTLEVLDGNQRFKACKELGFEKAPVKILPEDTPADKMRAYVAKDNVSNGKWDDFLLEKEWDLEELRKWGIAIQEPEDEEDDSKNNKIKDSCNEVTIVKCKCCLSFKVKTCVINPRKQCKTCDVSSTS